MMENQENSKKVVAYMHGTVGAGWWGDINAKRLAKCSITLTLTKLNYTFILAVVMHLKVLRFVTYLRSHKATVTAYVDGLAASAASLIAMGADKIIMPSNTTMMVHRASTYAYGNADSLEKQAKMLRDVDDALIQSYRNRFNGEFHELEALLDNGNVHDC
ncbi:ATP-dependent Clp protease proteolytic subunit [Bacillus pacificus]